MVLLNPPSLIHSIQINLYHFIVMDRINDILQSCIRASNIKLSYIEELFPDFKNKPYIVLHKNVSDIIYLLYNFTKK